jgi:hypothetical protein
MDFAASEKPLRSFIRNIGKRLALCVERSNDSELGLDILLGRSRRRAARSWDGGDRAQQYARYQGAGPRNRESKIGSTSPRARTNLGYVESSPCFHG